jgi:Homing endonuclease associated repeat
VAKQDWSKEEVIAQIQECAERLGHCPSIPELAAKAKITLGTLRKNFGTYSRALRECGLERQGPGYKVDLMDLFKEWAEMVRDLKLIPTMAEYSLRSQYSPRPLLGRFGSWTHVPRGLLLFAEQEELERQYGDVLDVIKAYYAGKVGPGRTSRKPIIITSERPLFTDRPVYGPSMVPTALAHGPMNEAGVVYLFGMMAESQRFVATHIQTEFPDCEAMWEVQPGKWQRVRVEFEYESRNFLKHLHEVKGCDVIVCWIHNWPECPLEVVELRSIVNAQLVAFREMMKIGAGASTDQH